MQCNALYLKCECYLEKVQGYPERIRPCKDDLKLFKYEENQFKLSLVPWI